MRKLLSLYLITLVLLGPLSAPAQTRRSGASTGASAAPAASRFGNVDAISAQRLKEHLTFIASDELEGRDTPSPGLDKAAQYIAGNLKKWGIKPAGDESTYFQKFPLRRFKVDPQGTKLELNGQTFKYGEDFLAFGLGTGKLGGKLVYAAHGMLVKSKNIDAFQGIDVKDKIVVAYDAVPNGVTAADLQREDSQGSLLHAQTSGAKAVILISTFGDLANWRSTVWTQSDRGTVRFGDSMPKITIPVIIVNPQVAVAMFRGEKSNATNVFNKAVTKEFVEPFELTKVANLEVAIKSETVYTQNVVGILEGSDPVLKNEYVAIGAHYDHVGMNPFFPGADKIWNGADDDGSGTVAVLNIAEAFAKGPRPKRSMLFIWHAGEEKGLWGSEYFSNHSTVPINSVITELNIDMIGRYQNPGDENHPQNKALPKPGEVFVIGSKMMSRELGEVSETINKALLNLSFNYKYDDPNDPEQFFYRSDHFNYAKKGVPIIFYMDGNHADYHQVSDSIEKINFEQMEKVTRTILATGWELANRPKRPAVDKPLPASVIGN